MTTYRSDEPNEFYVYEGNVDTRNISVTNAQVTALRNTCINIQRLDATKPLLGNDTIKELAIQANNLKVELLNIGYTVEQVNKIINSCRN
jgi:hypothetical protein